MVRSLLVIVGVSVLAGCTATSGDVGEREEGAERTHGVEEGNLHTLWIHGRVPSGAPEIGNDQDFSYWGPADVEAGANKHAVNWGGWDRISASNGAVRDALDCFCTGERWCVIAAHSAGDAQIGYAMSLYGDSDRPVTDGAPDGGGQCAGTGHSQTGWNIKWVSVAGGAAGGTELADLGSWAVGDPLASDLRTSTVRTLFDHNVTQGVWFYHFAGARGTAYSGALPGQDDEVIAYHSSGGMAAPGSFCNPGDWACDDTLRLAEAPSYVGQHEVRRWDRHTLALRDDGERYNHYTAGNWAGIVGPLLEDTAYHAQP